MNHSCAAERPRLNSTLTSTELLRARPARPPTHLRVQHVHRVARRLQPLEQRLTVALGKGALAHDGGGQLHRIPHQVNLLGAAVRQRDQRGGLDRLWAGAGLGECV